MGDACGPKKVIDPALGSNQYSTAESLALRQSIKASSFLVLYNLVEATFNSVLDSFFDDMRRRGASCAEILPGLQQLWARKMVTRPVRDGAQDDKINRTALKLVHHALRGATPALGPRDVVGGGNVDADELRRVGKQFGIRIRPARSARGGKDLEVVREARNGLGHGGMTFTDCGKDHSDAELIQMKDEVVAYLLDFVDASELAYRRASFLVETSLLSQAGIGPSHLEKLSVHLGAPGLAKYATDLELGSIPGVGPETIKKIRRALQD